MTSTTTSRDADGEFRRFVASNMRAVAAYLNVTQRGVARALGVSAPWVNERFSGRQAPTTDDIERIAVALGVTPMALMTGTLPRGGQSVGAAIDPTISATSARHRAADRWSMQVNPGVAEGDRELLPTG